MSRSGREILRQASLLDAAIAEIGERRSANVTVSEIARRAGVSSGLAHHYFGTKQNLLVAAMRRILKVYGEEVRRELHRARTPTERIGGVVRASFARSNFEPHVVRTWLILYLTAQAEPEAARLLAVYRRRLRSNLGHALRPLVGERSREVAELVAATIDGLYIRRALGDEGDMSVRPDALVMACVGRLVDPPA